MNIPGPCRQCPVIRGVRLFLPGLCLLLALPAGAASEAKPRLILQITVDALRADLPQRYAHLLGEGGFRYLLEDGVNYTNAHYRHANTETIVGHTSLATGTTPAAHGMIGNVWFDRDQGRLVYNIEDADYNLLTAGADIDKATEIDPTQRAAKVDGRSPLAILAPTFSDELALAWGGKSLIYGVSIKDRAAVSLAGQTGKAFWFSKASSEFVTSNYYFAEYPGWVNAWNARKPANAWSGKSWQLSHDRSAYRYGDSDDRNYETDFPGFGRTFPHTYGTADDKYFTTRLTLSPAGDELTLDFVKALIDNEPLGEDEIPDFLAVSFSSTDYVGHMFGASSLESEDNIGRLDRTLAQLIDYIDDKIGLEHTLIVLSVIGGQPEAPGHLNDLGIHSARYFDTEGLDRAPAIEALKRRFGLGEELIEAFFQPYLYLNHKLIADKGLDQAEVEQAVIAELLRFDGIAAAVSSSALRSGNLPDTALNRAILHNFHPDRSGDIYLVFAPNVFINDFDGLAVTATHGSPWRYDTHVPVVFAGAGVEPRRVSRPVTPYDIAPTLSAFLGIREPAASVGIPLAEVLGY